MGKPSNVTEKAPKKGQAKLKVNVDRLAGFKEPIDLDVHGLPPGVTVTGTKIAAGQNAADLTFEASETAVPCSRD